MGDLSNPERRMLMALQGREGAWTLEQVLAACDWDDQAVAVGAGHGLLNRGYVKIKESNTNAIKLAIEGEKAKENGIFLGMTSQCIDGQISMTVYESGRDLLDMGIIPLENMIPEVALVKAMWALGNSNSNNEIKDMMLENYSSEF